MPMLILLYDHLEWADGRALAALRAMPAGTGAAGQARAIYAHVAAAEHVWLARLDGRAPVHPVWPTLDIDAAATLAAESAAGLRAHALRDAADLARVVGYVNSAGQEFTNTVGDILAQVALHGSYHRGQLALLARQSGATPALTDYIAFVRGVDVPATNRMHLVWPSTTYLAGYVDALERGWSSDNLRPESAREELEHVSRDAQGFLAEQVDPEGKGPPITLADGTTVPRLPGYHRWMWDGEFCGEISFRWQPGTTELPPTCLGHIGYSVVPWKRRRGYATKALALLLADIRQHGLPFVELTASADNVASQRVIVANGGQLVERFSKPAVHGGTESLRFRVYFERG